MFNDILWNCYLTVRLFVYCVDSLEFPLTENGENVTTPSFIASEDFTQVSSPGTSKKPTIELAATNFVSFGIPSILGVY